VRTTLATGDGFVVSRVTTRARTTAWSDPELPGGHQVMFVRRGVFRARIGGRRLTADPTVAYLGGPEDEQSIAHQPGATDVCTALVLSADLMAEHLAVAGGVPVDGRVAVAHRRLTVVTDPFELAELVVRLVGAVLATPVQGTRRGLVDAAREVIVTGPGTLGLRDVARAVGCGPHHLSRAFHRDVGMTLTAFRNRVRVLRALDAFQAGAHDLSRLAADLGFADHAHLTRTVRRECGHPPRVLRALLAE
jgi:AraC-like DNA-binding protein